MPNFKFLKDTRSKSTLPTTGILVTIDKEPFMVSMALVAMPVPALTTIELLSNLNLAIHIGTSSVLAWAMVKLYFNPLGSLEIVLE